MEIGQKEVVEQKKVNQKAKTTAREGKIMA